MNIVKATHKMFLYNRFYNEQGAERNFPLDMLADASLALRKLRSSMEETPSEEENKVLLKTIDGDLEFTEGEARVLKHLIEMITEAPPSWAETIIELKELLK